MKTKIFILTLVIIFSSCSTIRLRHKSRFLIPNQKQGEFQFTQSIPVGSLQTWCLLTGIIYGGACWVYLGLPSESQKNEIDKNARIRLASLIRTDEFELSDVSVSKLSWNKEETIHQISNVWRKEEAQSESPKKTKQEQKESNKAVGNEIDDFLG